jgi:hypothetical protein
MMFDHDNDAHFYLLWIMQTWTDSFEIWYAIKWGRAQQGIEIGSSAGRKWGILDDWGYIMLSLGDQVI